MIRVTKGMRQQSYFRLFPFKVFHRDGRNALSGKDSGVFEPAGKFTPEVKRAIYPAGFEELPD